ncbi:MAG: SH3 domain-containing protein [Chloroflexota bacterium]|nr:SH3 domain-containing protein [Chloroflexota bacterium]
MSRISHRTALWRWLLPTLAALLALSALAPIATSAATDLILGEPAVISDANGDAVRLRDAPSASGDILRELPEGTTLEVLDGPFTSDDGGAWYQVRYTDTDGEETGYMAAAFLSVESAPSAAPVAPPAESEAEPSLVASAVGSATVQSSLNLRAGPSTADSVISVMPGGATVELTGSSANGFHQVIYQGQQGWAFATYLTIGGATTPQPLPGEESATGTATVNTSLNLRAGPSTADRVLMVMPAGAGVALNGQTSNGFLSVTYQGTSGWASATYLTTGGAPAPTPTPPPPSGGTATISVSLNLRAGPSTADRVLSVMPPGAVVTLTGGASNGFLALRYNGQDGWAAASFLTTGGGTTPAPPPPPTSGGATVRESLNLRAGPSTADRILTVMPAGARLSVTGGAVNGFLPVTYNGTAGWASAAFIDTGGTTPPPGGGTPPPVVDRATVQSALNLRAGPSTSTAVLAVMPGGATVEITGAPQSGFYPLRYNGAQGWASGDYLLIGGAGELPPPGGGGSGIRWPVSGGTWRIIQGYNGGSHQNRSASAQYYYSLDIARASGTTAGTSVVSPVNGRVAWNHPASGGIAIDMGNGYVLAMFHVTFLSSLTSGQQVSQGQYLGTISGPGGPGYAVTPHIDITLWRSSDGARTRSSTPFSGGNSIGGLNLADIGGAQQHTGTLFYP